MNIALSKKTWSEDNNTAFGYIVSGIRFPAQENMGGIVVIIDKTYEGFLDAEMEQLKLDLIGDGYYPVFHYVEREESVENVRSIIQDEYDNNPNITSVFLIGHVPVPYSGKIVPDGHIPDHFGAWPADVYYGDIDGNWTDNIVDTTEPDRDENDNIPGDGKFDQSFVPSKVELAVGRIDLYNMPLFADSDTTLLQYYFEKNHAYKQGKFDLRYRAVLDDNFPNYSIGATGWRNFAPMVSPDSIYKNATYDYLKELTATGNNYIWSFACGGGSYTSCAGVAVTDHFALYEEVNTVFTSLSGSYFGDWDTENNFLRAPLGSKPSCLISFWGGIPHWHIHPMAMGYNIGFCTVLTQNNKNNSPYDGNFNSCQNQVHISLHGDPTLKMYVVKPTSGVSADSLTTDQIEIVWDEAALDEDNDGYYVYRFNPLNLNFLRISPDIVTGESFIDTEPINGENIYMVRAVKLQVTPSGSFYNLSTGILDTAYIEVCPDAGTMNENLKVICSGNIIVANTINNHYNEENGQVLTYVLHPNKDLPLDNSIAFDSEGKFKQSNLEDAGLPVFNTTYYITAIAGYEDANGLPDPEQICFNQSASRPFVFLQPLDVTITEECDETSGEVTLNFKPIGGIPEYETGKSYVLTIDGNLNLVDAGDTFSKEGYHTNDNYTVEIITDDNCDDFYKESTVTTPCMGDGIDEDNKEWKSFSIQPNPVIHTCNISYNINQNTYTQIRLTDQFGKTIYDKQLLMITGHQTYSIDMQHLASGLYLLHIETDESKGVWKLMKQ